MEPLKNRVNEAYVDAIGKTIEASAGVSFLGFRDAVFDAEWEKRELMDRMAHIANVMGHQLPGSYKEQLPHVLGLMKVVPSGFDGVVLPHFVLAHGEEHWEASMLALEQLTQHSTGEFAIRLFLNQDLKKGMKQLVSWSKHENYHVRRLATEGCRPRLPWSMAIKPLKQDPSLIFPILENLLDDEEEYVRRSVANNLNDISKDHPDLVLAKCSAYLQANPGRKRLVKHALRGLLKQAHPNALQLFDYSKLDGFNGTLSLNQHSIPWEGQVELSLKMTSRKQKKLRIEYLIHFMKSNGKQQAKVFQWSEKESFIGETQMTKKHSFKELSTRKHYPGEHKISLRVNGEILDEQVLSLEKK